MVLGFVAASEVPGPHAVGRAVHLLFSLLTVVVLLGIHSIVYTYFVATGKWAKEVVRVYQLPDWYLAQARRNKRRAFRFVMGSMTAIAIAAWLGGAADTLGTRLCRLAPGRRGAGHRLQLRLLRRGVRRDRRPCPAARRLKDQADRLRGGALRADAGQPARSRRSAAREAGGRGRMSPLGVVVLIVLVDLLGFSVVMPLLAPFAKHYGFARVADRPVVLGLSDVPARGRADPGAAERPIRPPARSWSSARRGPRSRS